MNGWPSMRSIDGKFTWPITNEIAHTAVFTVSRNRDQNPRQHDKEKQYRHGANVDPFLGWLGILVLNSVRHVEKCGLMRFTGLVGPEIVLPIANKLRVKGANVLCLHLPKILLQLPVSC